MGRVVSDVVVCGGGVIGSAIAYHLAKRGARKVILLEQYSLGSGATSTTCGFVCANQPWQRKQIRVMAKKSAQLYQDLAQIHPDIGFKPCGRIYVAQTAATSIALQRMRALASSRRQRASMVSLDRASRYASLVRVKDLQSGLYVEDDAKVLPVALCYALAAEATKLGAEVLEGYRLNSVRVGADKKVHAVDTDAGLIHCDAFVDAAGLWTGWHALKDGMEGTVRLPMQSCSYSFFVSKACPETAALRNDDVVIHDLDSQVFLGTDWDGERFVGGGFDRAALQYPFVKTRGQPPDNFSVQQTAADWDSFHPILEKLLWRFPGMGKVQQERLVGGVDGFSPDGQMLIGEVPKIGGYYVATATGGLGVSLAGGVGELVAELVLGSLQQDTSHLDLLRFLDLHSNPQYLQKRTAEIASFSHYPRYHLHQCESARSLRTSAISQQLMDAGAVFGEIMGYERPLYFENTGERKSAFFYGQDTLAGKPVWFDRVAEEFEACRERVAIIDMTNFSKFEISADTDCVVEFLQRICSADIDRPVGTTVYSGVQNERGGYVVDCTLSRLAPNQYFVVAPTLAQTRLGHWLRAHVPAEGGIVVHDVTNAYTALNVVGPASRSLLQDLTGMPLGPSDFPTFRCRELPIGLAAGIRAISVTHCGELGWVLYIPNEFAQHVYEQLVDAGSNYGLRHAGYYTLRNLRMEKFYVYWGSDINAMTTPVECGRDFRVSYDKDFIGRAALLRQRETGVLRRYVQLLVDGHDIDADPWAQGGEPIYRDGALAGYTTTAGYGFTTKCQVCLGYVERLGETDGARQVITNEYVSEPNAAYELDIAGRRFPVRVNLRSPILPMVSSEHPTHYRPTQT